METNKKQEVDFILKECECRQECNGNITLSALVIDKYDDKKTFNPVVTYTKYTITDFKHNMQKLGRDYVYALLNPFVDAIKAKVTAEGEEWKKFYTKYGKKIIEVHDKILSLT